MPSKRAHFIQRHDFFSATHPSLCGNTTFEFGDTCDTFLCSDTHLPFWGHFKLFGDTNIIFVQMERHRQKCNGLQVRYGARRATRRGRTRMRVLMEDQKYDVPFAQILFGVPENFEVSPKGQVRVAAQKKCVASVAELKSSVAAQRWVCRQMKNIISLNKSMSL
jgi:hypothetical protein